MDSIFDATNATDKKKELDVSCIKLFFENSTMLRSPSTEGTALQPISLLLKSRAVFRPVSSLFSVEQSNRHTPCCVRIVHDVARSVISPKPLHTAYDFSIFSSVGIPLSRSHFFVNSVSDCVYIINPPILLVNFYKKVRALAQLYCAFFDRAHSISPFFHQEKM